MFLIQHGYSRTGKIETAVREGSAAGVIWGPCDEKSEALPIAMGSSELSGAIQAIDPQLYVGQLESPGLKKLGDYPFFLARPLAEDFTIQDQLDVVAATFAYQESLPVTAVISPTVAIDDVRGDWAQVATQLARAAVAGASGSERADALFISVAVREGVLATTGAADTLLNSLTKLEVAGFYLLFELDPDSDAARYSVLLENALWIVHQLAANDYRVWVGYAGLAGYVFRAAGAEAFGAGWWQKLQWWSPNHWAGGGGGRQPKPRIALDGLLSSILIDEELGRIRQVARGLYDRLLGGVGPLAAEFLAGELRAPSRDEMAAQLFAVCSELDRRITGTFLERARQVSDDITEASRVMRAIRSEGIELDAKSGPRRASAWQTALEGVALRAGQTL